jgi:Flp pilus assembly protein TadG
MRRISSFRQDRAGAVLVEMTLVFPMLLILTFGIVEFGVVFWEYHSAEKATAIGARWLATQHGVLGANALTSELYTSSVPDCFVSTTAAAGTPCSQVAGATGWSATCTGTGGGSCSSTVMSGLLTQMQGVAPFIRAANVTVTLQGSDMGFVGRNRAIPLITVRTTGLTYSFVAMSGLLGLGQITMPSFATTLEAEDQIEGPAP